MKKNTDIILNGNILQAILLFFFPILIGTFFQQLYNTVDAVIVGKFVGKEALAAVGGGSGIFVNLLVGFFTGISGGASVLVSQFFGAKDNIKISQAVHTGIMMCIFGGAIFSGIGIIFCRPMMILIKTPEEILDLSTLYLRIFFSGLIPMFLYNITSGIFRSVGDSKTPLLILIAGCFSNIILDLLFVVVLKMGVTGVAAATVICQIECSGISLFILHKRNEVYALRPKELKITPSILGGILRIGIPSGLQGSLYTISNLFLQSFINSFGTITIAAWAAYGKIDSIFWMTICSFGIAITTFSGQNYGAKKYDRMKKGFWTTLALSSGFTIVIIFIFVVFGRQMISLFSSDAEVIEKGYFIIMHLAPFFLAYISVEVVSGIVHGAGDVLVPTIITVFGICALRLLWLFIAFPLNSTLNTALFVYPITWIVTSIAFWIYYFSGKWLKKQ